MKKSIIKTILLPAGMLALGSPALANMGNTGTTYGLFPSDIASAQALSLFSTNTSSTYYNPANLVRDRRSEVTGAIFHAEHELNTESPNPAYDGNILDTPSQQLMLGLKADLSGLMKSEHPIYLGFVAGVDRYGKEMLAFSSSAEGDNAQYFQYDRQPLFLAASIGTNVWRGIKFGAGVQVTLHNDAELFITNDLGGTTTYERVSVQSSPQFRPLLGLTMNVGETFCHVEDCWLDKLHTAISYRASADQQTSVSSNAIIPGAVGSPGIPIEVNNVIDSFQPAVTAAGFQYDFGAWRLGFTAEYQEWSRLGSKLRDDTIKDQAGLEFEDIFVPRVGLEIDLNDVFMVTSGVAWEKSPLKNNSSLDVNYVDADRLVVGVGISANFKHVPMIAHPVTMSFGYQYQQLDERDFQLSRSQRLGQPDQTYGTVTTDGEVNVFAGSITMKF
ncbi:OmpP1/FadL family transporter [Alloalcanivorax marinus]|uniref:OmpP1/FadL family transporter n=1 Tax=Alloalcanivorax marinus TaxID=1177169 RepID=UPI001EE496BB|nr:aromatic hydrocarbon degradation protein [Alloalcanivorax marinus]